VRRPGRERGFSLVELAIVLTVIAILSVAILRSQTVLDRAAVAEAIAAIKDLRAAVATFRQRYRYLPGDFPVDAAHPEIPDVRGDCRMGGSGGGNGNGDIESPGESMCASEQLIRAGLIRGDPIAPIETRLGAVSLKRTADAGVSFSNQPQIRNVLVFGDVPCDVALEIDRKIDDGLLSAGSVRADDACLAPGSEKTRLQHFAVAL
jgi:prepilin-type N-terminal cleavage/methylation domain-containing protein